MCPENLFFVRLARKKGSPVPNHVISALYYVLPLYRIITYITYDLYKCIHHNIMCTYVLIRIAEQIYLHLRRGTYNLRADVGRPSALECTRVAMSESICRF